MSNTSIQLKKSGQTGNTPANLQFGEVAINYADGKLYYKNNTGGISFISNQLSFDTINSNNSLILATGISDTLSFVAGNNITIDTNTSTKTITINSTASGGSGADQYARDTANAAFIQANAAFNTANAGGGSTTDQYARDTANSASLYANGAFSQANTANTNAATADSKAVTAGSYANSAYTQANTATNNAAGASLYANGAFAQANAAFDKANTGVANTATTANVAINARITIVNTGIYFPIVTDTTITGSDTFHYSSNSFLLYAANSTFRATGNIWAGQFITVGTNIPVINSTGHWVGQPLVANNASTANVSNVAINARITVVNTGIYYPIVTDTTITGADTLHYSSNDFVMFAANNTFRATGNIWAVQNIAVGTNIPVVNSTGHWVGQALSATDSFARNTANASFIQANAAFNRVNTGAASFISSGTSNVFFAAANGNIVANVNGNTIFTVSETNILFTNEDINGANNIYATSFIANSAIRVAGTGGSLSGANNIFANNIVANVGMTIAGTNVLPYIQSSFDRANTDVTNITISSPGTYGNASYIPVITLTANGRINAISTIAAAGGGGGSGTDQFARDTANAAFIQANAAFNAANTGGGGGGGSGNTIINTFTGNGITNTFSLPTAPSSANNTIVNIDGVLQLHASYNISGANIVFSGTPANNAQIEVMTLSITSTGGGATGNTANLVNRTYTGDNTTVTFAVTSGVTNTSLIVTENGIIQEPGVDYYISGANVVFTTAPSTSVKVGIRELALSANTGSSSSGTTVGKAIAMAIVFGG